jgi:hypothetical protein
VRAVGSWLCGAIALACIAFFFWAPKPPPEDEGARSNWWTIADRPPACVPAGMSLSRYVAGLRVKHRACALRTPVIARTAIVECDDQVYVLAADESACAAVLTLVVP